MTTDRQLPYNRDAERSILGAMLRDNDVIPEVRRLVIPESFYFDAHQKICRAIFHLDGAGHAVDLVILAEHLHATQQLEAVGRHVYLAEVWDAAPTAANAEYYSQIKLSNALMIFATSLTPVRKSSAMRMTKPNRQRN
jgi:replicative DNA helicase